MQENKLIILGNLAPSKFCWGRVFDTGGVSPTVLENHGKVINILVGDQENEQNKKTYR